MAEVRRTAADRMAVRRTMVAATAVGGHHGKIGLDFVPAQQGSIATLPQQWEAQTALLTALFLSWICPIRIRPADRELRRAQSYFNPFTTYAPTATVRRDKRKALPSLEGLAG